jgi:hypothetical protein
MRRSGCFAGRFRSSGHERHVLISLGKLNCAATVRTSLAKLMRRLIDSAMASVELRQIEQIVELLEQGGDASSR